MTEAAEPSPPKQRQSNVPSIVIGAIFVIIGVWYLLDQTLGLEMPKINWRDIWPVFLIALGGIMLYRAAGRRT